MPDTDQVIYRQADGTETVFVPKDQRWPIVNRPAVGVRVVRPDTADPSKLGEWVLPTDPGILRPEAAKPAAPATAPPAWPKLAEMVADSKKERRGDGVDLADPRYRKPDGGALVENLRVVGFRQNVWVQNNALSGVVTLRNVRSFDAWRDLPVERTMGNGYWFGAGSRVNMDGCAAIGNGWQEDRPPNNRNEYRHGIYAFWGSTVNVRWSLFALNSGCGVQWKGAGDVADSLFYANGCGMQVLEGPVKVRRCLVVDGRRWAITDGDGKISVWSGCLGFSTYGPVDVDDVAVVGGPRQREPNPPGATNDRAYNGAAFVGSKAYAGNIEAPGKPPAGASWAAGSLYASDWTGGPSAGDAPFVQAGSKPPAGIAVQAFAPPADLADRVALLVQEARFTDRPIKDIVQEAFRAAKVPWLSAA